MLPRLKPYFGYEELLSLLSFPKIKVSNFEREFAMKFDAKYAVAFPYGRTGLLALFRALGIENKEIIIPAYTCVVVAHAVVLSNNRPKFVDITLDNFNMNLELLDKAINENTKVVVATHLFGYPMDMDRVKEIVEKHEKRYNHKIYIINDCAHSFGTKHNGKLVNNEGDAALFALNISKLISSIYGGMVTTNNKEINDKLLNIREELCSKPTVLKQVKRVIYFLTIYPTFQKNFYGIVNYIERNTKFIDRFTKYYDEGIIDFPGDWKEMIGRVEASVGIEQLEKYDEIVAGRIENAKFYNKYLTEKSGDKLKLPPIIEGATYSHYVPIVDDRNRVMNYARKKGVQLGQLIEYAIPYMKAYQKYKDDEFPVSKMCSEHTINVPNYKGVNSNKVLKELLNYYRER